MLGQQIAVLEKERGRPNTRRSRSPPVRSPEGGVQRAGKATTPGAGAHGFFGGPDTRGRVAGYMARTPGYAAITGRAAGETESVGRVAWGGGRPGHASVSRERAPHPQSPAPEAYLVQAKHAVASRAARGQAPGVTPMERKVRREGFSR